MSNIMLEDCPTKYEGCLVNTWYQIGIQLTQVFEDETLPDFLKTQTAIYLMFANDDDTVRETPDDIGKCLEWFLAGWNMDNTASGKGDKEKLFDYDVDQGRIFADFMSIYHIDLRTAKLHWWEFNWLLWNMPRDRSSFMQVIEIRTKKPSKHSTAEERVSIQKAKKIFGLKQPKQEFSAEEKAKIDEYDDYIKKLKDKALETIESR